MSHSPGKLSDRDRQRAPARAPGSLTDLGRGQTPAITGFEIVPIPSIVASTRSPGLRYVPEAEPTPLGVPVEITSPGSRVTKLDRKETTAATGKTIWDVEA